MLGNAGTGLNDARTILTVPILCQRARQPHAALLRAAPVNVSRTCPNAAR